MSDGDELASDGDELVSAGDGLGPQLVSAEDGLGSLRVSAGDGSESQRASGGGDLGSQRLSSGAEQSVVGGGRGVSADVREEPGVIEENGADPSAAGERLDAALLRDLGVGEARATLLQFSSAFCAPCRAVRRVSSEVADLVPGVQHVEVDAESHLDAVRALGIWRTPTLLVLDADGRVAKRATGVPGKPQLIAALGDVL
ncbi:thioredoxin family protein [Actinoplanes sp. M2I2]|uniref:TlpA family protein disulfide reductase n=1 Tax=Actinoplanes sp. M2I2 TaxID=1734444 RepID=UPI00202203BD|nr:thioredoxin family protein [Actinoplanes sp. M2I2]